ncbi:MAG TPA: hypothetical protein VFD03_07090 [Clostridia bacterium]|nr:hypothetical protein [Clostridia bacterium]
MTSPKSLIKKPKDWNVNINNNMLHQAAFMAEFNLQESGAKAGIDYTVMDCFNLGAFIYLSAKLEDVRRTIAGAIGNSIEDDDDCIEDSKDISDADQAKPKAKSPFIVGYQ